MLKARIVQHRSRVQGSLRSRMLAMAAELDDVITLGRGDPDFDAPAHVVEAAAAAMAAGDTHYTLPAGLPELLEAIADKL